MTDRGTASQRAHFERRTGDTPAANTLFFKGWTLPSFILKCLLSFSPLAPPPSHYFGEIGRHGQPWQHNVQSNILEMHVGVSIAITTLIKASHIVQPEEHYFSLTADPPPNCHPDSEPAKQDSETVTPQISTAHTLPLYYSLQQPPLSVSPAERCKCHGVAPPLSERFPECKIIQYTFYMEFTLSQKKHVNKKSHYIFKR